LYLFLFKKHVLIYKYQTCRLKFNYFLQIKQGTLVSRRWEFGAKFSAEISEELIGHMLRR